jgi:hypothetical protein
VRTRVSPLRGFGEASLSLMVAGGPRQQVLRPAELQADALSEQLMREGLFGPNRVFDPARGTNQRLEGHALFVEQGRASIRLDELGTVVVAQPLGTRAVVLTWSYQCS